MLRLTAQGLGLTTEAVEKAQLLARIERALHDQAGRGKRTLVIVDEAQNLPVSALEELRMLSNFQAGGSALIRSSCSASPSSASRSRTPGLEQLRQRIIATHHLEPMAADEIGPYLTHRLKMVGSTGRPRFTAGAYAALFRHSDGVPRRLNTLATRVLLHGAVEKLEEIGAAAVEAAYADLAADGHGKPAAAPVAAEPAMIDRPPVSFGDRRAAAVATAPAPQAFVGDPALLRRIATLEARLEEQDAALRRVLALLVDWVEGGAARKRDARRTNAA